MHKEIKQTKHRGVINVCEFVCIELFISLNISN